MTIGMDLGDKTSRDREGAVAIERFDRYHFQFIDASQ
jgi:hypothetical protein